VGYDKSKDNGINETGPGRACSVRSLPEDKVGVDVHVYLPIDNADRYVKRQAGEQERICLFPNTRCIDCETIGA
jgi:hypothetical protein